MNVEIGKFASIGRVLLLGLMLTFVVSCGKGGDRQQKYLERAEKYFAEENYDKARIEVKNVLQINPKNNDARHLLGEISFKDGNIRQAYGAFLSILEEDENHLGANLSLTQIFLAVRDYDKALEHANRVLTVEDNNTKAMGNKALALRGLEQMEQSEILAKQTIALDAGNAAAIGVLAQAFFESDQQEEALALIERGQEVNPDDLSIVRIKLAILERLGRKEALEVELIALTKKHPDTGAYADTLTKFYIREVELDKAENVVYDFAKNNADELEPKLKVIVFLLQHRSKEAAIQQVEAYLETDPDQSKYYLTLAQLHAFTGDKEQARAVLNKAIDRDPRSVAAIEARNRLAAMALEEKDVDAAKSLLEEVLQIEPENTVALLVRARISLSESRLNDGIADLRAITKNDPNSIDALKLLAAAHEASGSEGLALDGYKKIMALEKPDIRVLASAARLAINAEQYSEAENYIRLALELDENNAGLVTKLIRLLVKKEDWDTAGEFAKRLIESEKSKALGYFLQSGIDLRLEDFDAAISNLKNALIAEPKAVEPLTTIARVLFDKKSSSTAIDFVKAHCEKHTQLPHCAHIFGSLLAEDGQFNEAEVQFERALALNEKAVITYRQLAKLHAARKNLKGIESTFQRGVSATEDQSLSFDLANFYYQTQAFERARDIYLDMIEVNEDALSAKNNLAMLYAENLRSEENLKKATALIADLQDSDNPAYLDTVGWVLYLTGEYERAVTYLQAAVDKVGSSGLLQYHLGMAMYKSGDNVGAKKHLELAVENKEMRYGGFDVAESTLAELN